MKCLDDSELLAVLGGQKTVAARREDKALELAVTKLQTELKELARPPQNNQQQVLMMALLASRRG